MQTIHQDEVEREHGGGASVMGINIYTRRVGRCMEGKFDGGIGSRGGGI